MEINNGCVECISGSPQSLSSVLPALWSRKLAGAQIISKHQYYIK